MPRARLCPLLLALVAAVVESALRHPVTETFHSLVPDHAFSGMLRLAAVLVHSSPVCRARASAVAWSPRYRSPREASCGRLPPDGQKAPSPPRFLQA